MVESWAGLQNWQMMVLLTRRCNGRLTISNMDSACVPVPLDGIAGDLALGCAVDRCDTMLVDGPVGCKAG
jgi:hypothetical protein